jgi:hypothetical protein
MGEVRRDDGKRNMFWRSARSWPPRHPSTMRGGASRLPKVPDRRRFGLEEGAIRRMQDKVFFTVSLARMKIGALGGF